MTRRGTVSLSLILTKSHGWEWSHRTEWHHHSRYGARWNARNRPVDSGQMPLSTNTRPVMAFGPWQPLWTQVPTQCCKPWTTAAWPAEAGRCHGCRHGHGSEHGWRSHGQFGTCHRLTPNECLGTLVSGVAFVLHLQWDHGDTAPSCTSVPPCMDSMVDAKGWSLLPTRRPSIQVTIDVPAVHLQTRDVV